MMLLDEPFGALDALTRDRDAALARAPLARRPLDHAAGHPRRARGRLPLGPHLRPVAAPGPGRGASSRCPSAARASAAASRPRRTPSKPTSSPPFSTRTETPDASPDPRRAPRGQPRRRAGHQRRARLDAQHQPCRPLRRAGEGLVRRRRPRRRDPALYRHLLDDAGRERRRRVRRLLARSASSPTARRAPTSSPPMPSSSTRPAAWSSTPTARTSKRPQISIGMTYAGFGTDWEKTLISTMIEAAGGEGEFETVTLGTSAYEALATGRVDFTLEVVTWEGVNAELTGRDQRAFRLRRLRHPRPAHDPDRRPRSSGSTRTPRPPRPSSRRRSAATASPPRTQTRRPRS